MDDAAFREQFKPVHVPARYEEARNLQDKVIFALAELGEATADQVIVNLEELDPGMPDKEATANVHEVLTSLFERGLISGIETNGQLVYNLHKITRANDGRVDPGLLAPGLD